MQFADLGLIEPILRAVAVEGYSTAMPIQAQAIPYILEGRDLVGCAQTGTGKTAAFALPMLQQLAAQPSRATKKGRLPLQLVLCPTRELAVQIADSFKAYGKFLDIRGALVFGGVNQNPQVDSIRRGVDVIVATPGRLLDLMQQGHIDLREVEMLVLDEADRMLDMGFIGDIQAVVAKMPARKQTLLFSATMPAPIRKLASTLLSNPARIEIAPEVTTAEGIEQSIYMVDRRSKPDLLAHLVEESDMSRTIVFTRTKHGADRLVKHLFRRGIRAQAIHSDKSQSSRLNAMDNFRRGKTPLLIATDIASRGIDVDGVSHVVNFDLTYDAETYVHRIGRTARAGATGSAISFCDREDLKSLRAIERLIGRNIPVRQLPNLSHLEPLEARPVDSARPPKSEDRNGRPRYGQAPRSGGSAVAKRAAGSAPALADRPKGKRPPRKAKPAHSGSTARNGRPVEAGVSSSTDGHGTGKAHARPKGPRPARSEGRSRPAAPAGARQAARPAKRKRGGPKRTLR